MDPQILIALIVGLGAGVSAGLLARGRITLRCTHCRTPLPTQCADIPACQARHEGVGFVSLHIGDRT